MFERLFKIQTLVVIMVLIAQFVLPIGSAFATSIGSMLPPSNLSFEKPSPEDVKLTWNSVYGASGYNVYEIQDGQLIFIGTTKTTNYILNDMSEGNYTYTVTTLNGDAETGPSAPITVEVAYPTMSAPANLSYKIQNGNDLTINWSSSQYAQEYFIYEVLENDEHKLLTTTTSNSYTKSNAEAGTYTYAVSASNSFFGESVLSTPVTAVVIQPVMKKPANLTFTLSNGTDVTLKWNAAEFANNYKVYQIIDGQKVLKETVTSTSLKLLNQPEGDYVYVVHSFSERFGESEEGSEISLTVSPIVMQAPNASAKVQNLNDVVLSWGRVDYANSYKIYQIVDGEKVLKSSVTGTSVTYSKQPSGEYQYEVYSYSDRYGESETGTRLSLSVNSYNLEAPVKINHEVINGNDLKLSWDPVLNANQYKVYQIVNGTKVLKSTVSGTTVSFSNLSEGKNDFEVFAYSTQLGESNTGASISVNIVYPEMVSPSNLAYTSSTPTEFTLTWDKLDYATNYKVYQVVNGQKTLKSTVTGISVRYTNMLAGQYKYEVYSYSSRFGESKIGSPIEVYLDGYVMKTPENLKYTILNGNDIKLEWSPVEYAASYKIYQVIDGEKLLIKTANGTNTTLSNQPAGEYEYLVYSYSNFSSQSPEGAMVKLSLVHPVMEKPVNLTAVIQNGNDIALAWNSVHYATSYNIYEIKDGSEELISTVSSATSPKKTLTNVTEGEHKYLVRSVSSRFGESKEGSSISVSVDFPVMQKPANLTQSIANGNDIVLRWNAAAYATHYKIYRMNNGARELLRTVTGTSTNLTNMLEGEYDLHITSYSDRFGESAESSSVGFSLVFPIMQAPANLTNSIANGNDIVLRWNAATYANSYNVYQVMNGQKEFVKNVKSTSFTVIDMPEADYHYEVHSNSDRFGESPVSSKTELTLIWPKVQAPVLQGTVFDANNITLSWPKVTWANGYKVYKVNGEVRELLYKGTAQSFKVYNLTEDTHSFEVVAYSDRFGESPDSNKYTETIVYPEMEAPKASLKLLSATSARISWDFVTYANGYNIYEIIDGKSVLIVEKVNNLSYTLSNLTYANHLYYVTSYSNSFGESDASETVLAKLIIDEEAPITIANASTDWTNQTTTVNLTATDNETGVKATFYSLDGYNFEEGTSLTVEAEGVHTITFYSVDNVGNKEEAKTAEVKIDKTTPKTTSDLTDQWDTDEVKVQLTAVDHLSGVEKTFYSIDGSEYVEGTSFTITGDKVHEVSYYSIDNTGNKEEAVTQTVKIDSESPLTTSDIVNRWNQTSVEVNLTATDNLSGVAKTFYSVDGSEYVEGTSLTVTGDEIHLVSYYSVDNAGNEEEVKTHEVKIDSKAPSTTSDIVDNWNQTGVKVKLTAMDNLSGSAKTFYSVDGSQYVEGTSFTVTGDKVHVVSYYSVDNAGNEEKVKTQEVKIDGIAPKTTDDVSDQWSQTDVKVLLTAEDNLSGVEKTFVSLNGSEFVEGTSLMVTTEGINEVKYYSVDVAGNKEDIKTILVKVDKTAPVIIAGINKEYMLGSEIGVSYSTVEEHSRVAIEEVTLNGVAYQNGETVTLDQPGVYTLIIKVTDHAGWTTTFEKEFVVYIPVSLEVLPKVIKGNKGIFSVKANLPAEFAGSAFEVSTATLNGVAPKLDNNGLTKQAEKGHFKFEREDFDWRTGKVELEFRAYLENGFLVVGKTIVDVK